MQKREVKLLVVAQGVAQVGLLAVLLLGLLLAAGCEGGLGTGKGDAWVMGDYYVPPDGPPGDGAGQGDGGGTIKDSGKLPVKDGGGTGGDGGGGPVPGTWVKIPKGSFTMGSPTGEPCRAVMTGKETQHKVTLTRAFEISKTEVTQAQYKALMGTNPSAFAKSGTCASSDCPVDSVNYNDAALYCNALSKQKGVAACYTCTGSASIKSCAPAAAYAGKKIYGCPGYRLPTEAEWEYAYRAGTTTAYYSGAKDPSKCGLCSKGEASLEPIGWYCGNASNTTHPVGKKQPNKWKLYDMSGNMWEWCHDWYVEDLGSAAVTDPAGPASGTYRILRGGSFESLNRDTRAATRRGDKPFQQYSSYGFRCVRSL
jgi:formylglycine-generating enzyme required for sulfatase activity